MTEKNDVQVIINGKPYTLCGYESSDYLQHIANHINEKYTEFKAQEDYNRLDVDMRNILLAINLSDDFFKAQKQADELKQHQTELEQEIFNMRHEIVQRDEKVKELEERIRELEEENADAEKRYIRMEAELEQKTQQLQHEQELKLRAQQGQVVKQPMRPTVQPQAAPGPHPAVTVPTSVRTGQPVLTQTAKPGAPIAQPAASMIMQGTVPGAASAAVPAGTQVRTLASAGPVREAVPVMAKAPVASTASAVPAATVASTVSAAATASGSSGAVDIPASGSVPGVPAVPAGTVSAAGEQKAPASTVPASEEAAGAEPAGEDGSVMSGILPAAPGQEEEPSIAAFDLEPPPKAEVPSYAKKGRGKGKRHKKR